MSERSYPCGRCGNVPYYDGHKDWCAEILNLEERLEKLEHRYATLEAVVKSNFPDFDIDYAVYERVTQYQER